MSSRRSTWPRECPVFANRLYRKGSILPDVMVGEGWDDVFKRFQCRRIDNQDRVWYHARELRPLTWAAREMLKAVKRG